MPTLLFTLRLINRLISMRKSVFHEFEKFSQHLVVCKKFELFYDVWVEKNILEGLVKFSTPIWFSSTSNHSYGFLAYKV